MKYFISTLLSVIALSCQLKVPQLISNDVKELYPIIENGLWGYIDESGKVIIKPKFHSVGQFSEGVAPARLNGTYGYIDKNGDFLLKPKFDVAYSFNDGIAKVYIEEKPYYIDPKGAISFDHNYSEIDDFGKNFFSIVITKLGNYGVIDKKGQLLVDTVYKKINPFSDGLAIVTGQNHEPFPDGDDEKPIFEIGVIASDGTVIVPFGKYRDISDFKNGFAKVELNVNRGKGSYDREGVIDKTGNLKFTIPSKKWHLDYNNGNFTEGRAIADIYSVDRDTIKVWSSSKRYTYKGVINTDGEIIFSNENWEEITPFKHKRAFIKDISENWYLIDEKGELLNKQAYKEILYEVYNGNSGHIFQDGTQFVKMDKGWGAIDTTGKLLIMPKDIDTYYCELYKRGQIIFIGEDISIESDKYYYQYGFWNTETGTVIEPKFHHIDFSGFKDELIYVMQGDRTGYINHQGDYVWREKPRKQQKNGGFNIDYMTRGYFYASSPFKEELAGYGGWGSSSNKFQRISKSNKFKSGDLSLKVRPRHKELYQETNKGIKMFIANTTLDTFFFDVQDSRLYLKIQALDNNGLWRDIEYLPNSWCGNSYHSLFLPPNHFWEFTIPKYEGEMKTKLRAELLYKKDKDQKESQIIYSNEFKGSINPGQFWRKNPYYPTGLMDPYNN